IAPGLLLVDIPFLKIKKIKNISLKKDCNDGMVLRHSDGFVYDTLRGLARNLANKNRIENPRGFS
ncbi:hypothetical protein ACFSQ0_03215, partial [Mesonia sediminis]